MALIPDDWLESHPEFVQEISRSMQLKFDTMARESFFSTSTAQAASTEEYVCEKCGRRFPAPLYGRSVIHECGIVIDAVAVDVDLDPAGWKMREDALLRIRVGLPYSWPLPPLLSSGS